MLFPPAFPFGTSPSITQGLAMKQTFQRHRSAFQIEAAIGFYDFCSGPLGGALVVVVVVETGELVGGRSLPFMPSLNSRMPCPSPFITSGIFLPPNKITMVSNR